MRITLDQLVENLSSSGLMPADEAVSLCESLSTLSGPSESDTVVQGLVGSGKLTTYQAECVCQGETSGLVFGDYVVLDKIGQGGMGVVLKAQHTRMERIVAVKKLTAAALQSEDLVKRFYREVKASARLLHPNVVTALDAREHEGVHYLIMEYIEGEDLAEVLKERGPLPVEEAVDYVVQAGQGLEFAHEHGVFHRDIKPANLLLDQKGTVKILDMGLARIVSEAKGNEGGEDKLTSDDQVMGTCDYMAPEQAENTSGVDHRADIYSLGCTLYRMLTGNPPYTGGNLMQLLLAHREHPIPSICDKRPDVPASVDAVFGKMVAKQLDDRYQSMSEVIEALQAALGRGPAPAAAAAPDPGLMDFLKQIHQEPSGVTRGGRGSGMTDVAQAAATVQQKSAPAADQTIDYVADADTDPSTITRRPSTPTAPSPRPRRPATRRKQKQTRMLLLIGACVGLSLIGAVVLAVVIYVQTNRGTIIVDARDQNIQVSVQRGGQEVDVIDANDHWRIKAKAGEYHVEIKGGHDQLTLDKDTVTVTRGDQVRLKLELKPRQLAQVGTQPPGQVQPETVWIEGEDAATSDVNKHGWYDAVERWQLFGGDWLSHNHKGKIGQATYEFEVKRDATYDFWIRANPYRCQLSYQLDNRAQTDIEGRTGIDSAGWVSQSSLAGFDIRFIAWKNVGQVRLEPGAHTIRFWLASYDPNFLEHHGGIDAFLFTTEDFQPTEPVKLGEWINVLPLIDPEADRVQQDGVGANAWEKRDGQLVYTGDQKHGKIVFPLAVDAAGCELEVLFARTEGDGGFDLHLPAPGGTIVVQFARNGQDQLGRVSETAKPTIVETGERTGIHARAVHRSGRLTVAVRKHTNSVCLWTGRLEEATVQFGTTGLDAHTAALYVHPQTSLVFHKIRLRPIGGTARLHRGTGAPSLPADAPKPAIAPFDAVRAKEHQEAWAEYLGLPVQQDFDLPGGEKLTMVLIPPGEFLMGSPENEWEGPKHRVQISRPLYVGRHEVTQAQWESVMGNNPSQFDAPKNPVETVSWEDIQPFLAKLNMDPVGEGMTFVLPTEAEWEYVCRAGTESPYCCDDDVATLSEFAWHGENSGARPHPVGEKTANAWGLCDVHGNVSESCADWYVGPYYRTSPTKDPVGPEAGRGHVRRGGSWHSPPENCRSAARFRDPPDDRSHGHGFRLACTIPYTPGTKPVELKLPPDAPPPAIAPLDADEAEPDEQAGAGEDSADDVRTWTDTSDNTVEATFIKLERGVVHLRRSDGKIAEVPLEKLSRQDQAYVSQQAEDSVAP